jgi:hypothetical protein
LTARLDRSALQTVHIGWLREVAVLVVVTRLQSRSLSATAEVGRLSQQVVAQLSAVPGFVGGRLLLDRRGGAWTITGWTDRSALDGFRTAHADVAARLDEVASDSASTAWVADGLPSWAEVGRRWTAVPPPSLGLRATIAPARAVAAP